MKAFRVLALAALASFGLSAAASATTVSGIIEEGGPAGYYYPGVADHTFADFGNATGGPVLTAGGPMTIYGSVVHRRPNRFKDGWTMDFGSDVYAGSFSWQNQLRRPFDGRLIVDGISTAISGSGSLALSGLTGVVTFQVDPIFGVNLPREMIRWQMQLAPVPLPAGAVLLLSALGGFAALRRRRSAAA